MPAWAARFWLFSGGGPGPDDFYDFLYYINDLWQYQPSLATLPAAAPPIFSSQSVIYQPGGKVTLANGMANATFYYTTDGSTPTTASNLYSGPVTIASSETVKAMATAPGYDNSIVTSTTYTVYPVPAWPINLTPYVFIVVLLVGVGYMIWLERKRPGALQRGATKLVGRTTDAQGDVDWDDGSGVAGVSGVSGAAGAAADGS